MCELQMNCIYNSQGTNSYPSILFMSKIINLTYMILLSYFRVNIHQHVSATNERTPLLASSSEEVEIVSAKKEPSLVKVLAKCYSFTLLQAHLCKLVCDLLTFAGPQLQL